MTDKLLIERELLEDLRDAANDCLNHEIMRGNDRNVPAYTELVEQADAALAAPRQPEGDGLEVVGYVAVTIPDPRYSDWYAVWTREKAAGIGSTPLCRLPDAQRAIAELRDRLDVMTQCADNYSRMFEESEEECERLSRMLNNVTNDGIKLADERDTLRQQLAERDAEIERLLTALSETVGNGGVILRQRDKLAGLLREVLNWSEPDLEQRIKAALAEINK